MGAGGAVGRLAAFNLATDRRFRKTAATLANNNPPRNKEAGWKRTDRNEPKAATAAKAG